LIHATESHKFAFPLRAIASYVSDKSQLPLFFKIALPLRITSSASFLLDLWVLDPS
jgi:hypothetical protein